MLMVFWLVIYLGLRFNLEGISYLTPNGVQVHYIETTGMHAPQQKQANA